MLLEVKAVPSRFEISPCDSELLEIDVLKGLISRITIRNDSGPSTKQLEKKLLPLMKEIGWELDFKFDSSTASTFPIANYTLNAIKNFSSTQCSHDHRLLFELCFDNRQAIGTNLLKFQAATNKFQKSPTRKATSILVCGERSTLETLNWDGGVASQSEYENALRTVYRDLFAFELVYMVLSGA